jgi:hypothetical protein
MKLNLAIKATKATLFAAALLTPILFAGSANAQSYFQGQFTLQQATRWGRSVLPAGEYRIRAAISNPTVFTIEDAKTGKMVAYEFSSIVERVPQNEDHSELLLGTRGQQRVIYSFHVVELRESLIYDRALANGHGVLEARDTETVPVLLARK